MYKPQIPLGALRAGAVALVLLLGAFHAEAVFAQETSQHTVKAGDTLFRISRTYGVTLDALREVNRISGDEIHVGQVLLIPDNRATTKTRESAPPAGLPVAPSIVSDSIVVPVQAEPSTAETVPPDSAALAYVTVKRGQSLFDIASAVRLDIESLRALNPSLPAFLDTMEIAVPARSVVSSYTVRMGDTLYKIAREHESSVDAIRRENGLASDEIRVGQALRIPVAGGRSVAADRDPPLLATGYVRPYPSRFQGRLMASGRPYDENRYYVSHVDLPFKSIVLLSTDRAGSEVFAEVVDRLPSTADYLMDVSLVVALALDVGGKSNPQVNIRVVRFGPDK